MLGTNFEKSVSYYLCDLQKFMKSAYESPKDWEVGRDMKPLSATLSYIQDKVYSVHKASVSMELVEYQQSYEFAVWSGIPHVL